MIYRELPHGRMIWFLTHRLSPWVPVFGTFSLFALKRIKVNMDLIRFIFACFGIFANTTYLHLSLHIFPSKYSHKSPIWCKTNICWRKYSLQSKYLLRIFSYLLQKIIFEANIHKIWSEFNIQVNIRLQIFTHLQIFATYCFKQERLSQVLGLN